MSRTASAVVRLIECGRCKGFVALGSCVCANNKQGQKHEVTSNPFAASVLATSACPATRDTAAAATSNHLEGAL